MLSPIGWLDGLSAALIVISASFFGLLSFYKSRKVEAKLLGIAGLMMVFVGLLWLGPLTDFLVVLITGNNIYPKEIYGYLSYMWVAPAIIVGMYLGGELIFPKLKRHIVIGFAILGVIFELFLFIDTANTFEKLAAAHPGKDLIDAQFNRASPTFILIAIFLLSALGFDGIGFLIKAIQSTGELRKKFLLLFTSTIVFVIAGALDSIIPPGLAIGFIRAVGATSALWMYLGLKT
ncbi:MAG: hypothetical protein EU529_15415 [Promethearchaeota archaeon]|nr:MAG: hypothetical protein EU529_15415 [Candidatus Lokiarchaeota archaeon]